VNRSKMQAIRLHPPQSDAEPRFSAANPAPTTAMVLDTIPMPTLSKPGQLLIRVHATTVTRAELTWPETYSTDLPLLGHDLAGTVVAVQTDTNDTGSDFKPGDKVYGMLDMSKGSTWAEYAIAWTDQVATKPETLNWAESAAVPVSALTAWQALFVNAGVPPPDFSSIVQTDVRAKDPGERTQKIAVTGAAGAVGSYLVQLAALAGLYVVAVSSSKSRDEYFLKSLGAHGLLEYEDLRHVKDKYDIIIDAVGGETLERCWSSIKDDGVLISVESACSNFVQEHRGQQFAKGKENVRALFFIVEPSRKHLEELSLALNLGLLKVFVAEVLPLQDARAAYELANGRLKRPGKVVLTVAV
jgi:NADPH:quinone reductase-like Zn-dependent oxidoreductase